MKSSDGKCSECPSGAVSGVIVGISVLVAILVATFLIKKNNRSVKLPTPDDVIKKGVTSAEKITIAFRILMAFIQLTRLTTSFILPWPTSYKESTEAVAVVTEPSVMMRAFPCFASSDSAGLSFTLKKAIMVAVAPILCILLPCVVYGALKLHKGTETVQPGDDTYSSFSSRTIAAVVCLLFVIYPSLVKSTFALLTCVTLEQTDTTSLEVLRSDNGVQCWEGDHSAVVWLLFGPCLIVWVVGIPLLASLLMRHYQRHWICPECGTKSPLTQASCSCGAPVGQDGERMLYSIGVQRKFAFLYKGYEPQYYYWELVVLSRKMIFVVIDVLGETLGPIIQTVLALLTVIVALLLHIKCEPYQVGEIDTLERISLTSSVFTLLAGLFYYGRAYGENGVEDVEDDLSSWVCTVLVMLINVWVILYFFVSLSWVPLPCPEGGGFVRESCVEFFQARKEKKKKKALEGELEGDDLKPRTEKEEEGLPAAFTEKKLLLEETIEKIDAITKDLDKIRTNEKLEGFRGDVAAAQLWMDRLRDAVDWKERQADAVVRRHDWEVATRAVESPKQPCESHAQPACQPASDVTVACVRSAAGIAEVRERRRGGAADVAGSRGRHDRARRGQRRGRARHGGAAGRGGPPPGRRPGAWLCGPVKPMHGCVVAHAHRHGRELQLLYRYEYFCCRSGDSSSSCFAIVC